MAASNQPSFCQLCHEFTKDLAASITNEDPILQTSSNRWASLFFTASDAEPAFQHHETFEALVASATTCPLCRLFAEEFTREGGGADGPDGLALFVGSRSWSHAGYEKRVMHDVINATFQRGRVFYSYKDLWEPHEFHIRRHQPYDQGGSALNPEDREKRWRAMPEDVASKDAFDTARFWLQNCSKNHAQCQRESSSLPTRVIDVGVKPDDVPCLYIAKGEKQRFAALTHCWGGNVPDKTTIALLEQYKRQLPMDTMPQNFLDAIRVTRELGLRYLWIDALCIIQDSESDWINEASRMASVYSQAFVTISALDAKNSTEGFLGSRSLERVQINPNIFISTEMPSISDYLRQSALDSRGWCMQERLLSPALLHYSKGGPMIWECRAGAASEIDGQRTLSANRRQRDQDESHLFFQLRQEFLLQRPSDYMSWYKLVEQYSSRKLTVASDKLPALAGAAQEFVTNGMTSQYAAGLWEDDIVTGLFWFARGIRDKNTAVYSMHGRHTLQKPAKSRAPSWSWAAVDGPVEFLFKAMPSSNIADPAVFRVLGVDVSKGHNAVAALHVEGAVRIRGLVARVRYFGRPNQLGSIGWPDDEQEKEDFRSIGFITAIMDVDGDAARDCWVAVSQVGEHSKPGVLLLERLREGVFRRSGAGQTPFGLREEEFARFSMEEFSLV